MIPAFLNVLQPVDLVYFRTNKPVYGPGETVWISWKVTGVWNVEINGSKYSSQGVLKLEKCSISTFTLRTYSEKKPICKSIQVVFSENSLVTLRRSIDTRVAELAIPQLSFIIDKTNNNQYFSEIYLSKIVIPFREFIKNRKFSMYRYNDLTYGLKKIKMKLSSTILKANAFTNTVN